MLVATYLLRTRPGVDKALVRLDTYQGLIKPLSIPCQVPGKLPAIE